MKNLVKSIVLVTILALGSSCSPSLTILNSWTESEANLIGKNVLVITKVKDNSARIESEEAIKRYLLASDIKAQSSFYLFSIIDPNRKVSEAEVGNIVKKIKKKGFNAIVLTTLKDYDETVYTRQTGGYYAGGSYYGGYYGNFNSYFGRVYSYYDRGIYVPSETKEYVSKKYVLETVTYDLDLSEDKGLISISSIKIENPENLKSITKKYAKSVVSKILKK